MASGLIGSLLGVFLLWLKALTPSERQISSGQESSLTGISKRAITVLIATAVVTTLLLANQISSIRNLRNVAESTTIKGWTDVILHANTVLSLSSLPQGQAPISTLDYADPIVPYHYASYILSSLFSSLSPQASPLESFMAIVAPLGCLLILLPLSEEALNAKYKHASIALLSTGSILFLLYSIWVRLIGDSLLDPAWLLITAPATLYACAIVLSAIQICSETYNQKPFFFIPLVLLGFLLTAFAKIQIAHAVLPMAVVSITVIGFSVLRCEQALRVNHPIIISLGAVSLLAAVHLCGNSILGIGRRHPIGEVMGFLRIITEKTWGHINFGHASAFTIVWLAPLLGFLTLCGPLFLIALISGITGPARQSFGVRVLVLVVFSYMLSLVFSPTMPWDDGEFLNRSWPLLWCVGAWAILDRRPFRFHLQQPQRLLITSSMIALLLGWIILPGSKKESIASPARPKDWSQIYYPTTVSATEKKLALKLKRLHTSPYFFANSSLKNSYSKIDFDDLPSRLAALSGARPLLTRVLFQKSLQMNPGKSGLDLPIESRYRQMLKRYGTACDESAGTSGLISTFDDSGLRKKVYVVCQDLEGSSP